MIDGSMTCRLVADPDAEVRYLAALNVCFPGWGDRAMFDWCFAREGSWPRADLMTLHADGHVIAGTANTYRRVRLANGQGLTVAIMTGSWTLPEARGRGAFTRLIDESRDRAAARGAGLLLAYVACGNASASRLRAAGAALVPTWYCRSAVDVPSPLESPAPRAAAHPIAEGADRQQWPDNLFAPGAPADLTQFLYTDREWRAQFLDRPAAPVRVRDAGAHRWAALVDRASLFDRVLAVAPAHDDGACLDAISALTARARAAGRRLFTFTTTASRAASLRERGFDLIDGWLTALVADEAALRQARGPDPGAPASSWPPLVSGALTDRTSPWYLGDWFVQNGDRM